MIEPKFHRPNLQQYRTAVRGYDRHKPSKRGLGLVSVVVILLSILAWLTVFYFGYY